MTTTMRVAFTKSLSELGGLGEAVVSGSVSPDRYGGWPTLGCSTVADRTAG